MDNEYRHDIGEDVDLHVPEATQEESSTRSTDSGLSADVPTYCYDECNIIISSVKTEEEQPESMQEDSASRLQSSLDACIVSALEESVKCEEESQEFGVQELQFKDTDEGETSTHVGGEIVNVKQDVKGASYKYDRNSKETKHWIVCENGVVEEVRTDCNNGREKGAGDCSENDDRRQQSCCATTTTKHTNVRRRKNSLTVRDYKTHTGLRRFICSTCGKKFPQANRLRVHKRRHAGVKPFSCTTCEKTFVTSWDLKVHERTHTGVKPYKCTTCGKTFATSSSRKEHERRHTGAKPFMCKTCGKTFLRSSDFKTHERTHTGVKPYTCTTCGKKFAHANHLGVHSRRHAGVKPFSCATCEKTFVRSYDLKVHERIHTGVKLCTCATCGKTFASSSSRNKHERRGACVKPFMCITCGKRSSRTLISFSMASSTSHLTDLPDLQ